MTNQKFNMPAEWAPHQAILLSWPHNPRTWPGHVEDVRQTYMHFIREVTSSEDLWLFVKDETVAQDVRRRLTLAGVSDARVTFITHPTNDSWIRDYGPIAVYDEAGKLALSNWIFNGWGDKYAHEENYENDNIVPNVVAKKLNCELISQNIILEGGSIDVNGKGTILTSKSCLLNSNRNSHLSQNQIVKIIESTLGVRHWIWVPEGIAGDDTDGHIDDTVRFVNDHTVVCMFEENTADENHAPLKACYDVLSASTDQDGRPLRVIKLPMPTPVEFDGERLPASYANFLICNTKVLVPTFACKEDAVALQILQDLFPTRQVVGIDARALVIGFGSLHCLSQQIPKNQM